MNYARHDPDTGSGIVANDFEFGGTKRDMLDHIAYLKTQKAAFEVEAQVYRDAVLARQSELSVLRSELEKEGQALRMELHRSRDLCIDVLRGSVEQIQNSNACGDCVHIAMHCNRQRECRGDRMYGRYCVPMEVLTRRENALVQLRKIEDRLDMPPPNRFARNARDIVPFNVWHAAQSGRCFSPHRARRYPKYPGMKY